MEAGPGLSLFQGSESIQLNTVAQRLEEDEEQEDKRRREGEVTPLFFFLSVGLLYTFTSYISWRRDLQCKSFPYRVSLCAEKEKEREKLYNILLHFLQKRSGK